jgi:hypothetical protein
VFPWTSGRPVDQYLIAGILLAIGIVLWAVTYLHRRKSGYGGAAALDTTGLKVVTQDPAKLKE